MRATGISEFVRQRYREIGRKIGSKKSSMSEQNLSAKNLSGSEPTSPLTQEWDETLKAQLAMGMLQALDNRSVIDETLRKQKRMNDIHLAMAESQAKGGSDVKSSPESDVGNVVKIDSPDLYVDEGSNPLPWILASILGTAGAGLLIWSLLRDNQKPTPQPPPAAVDTDTRSTLRPYTGADPQ
jgi:hypothetical protein